MNRKFWNWQQSEESQERTLRIEGVIADGETWLDNTVTPKLFRDELNSSGGDISVWLNSPGGDVFAGSQIYTMLKEYKGKVTIFVDALAGSAASVIAMAGDVLKMSPTSYLFMHDPETISIGNTAEMELAIKMLKEIKEGIVTAYELKTKLPRDKIGKMMSSETWLNATKAVELGFADEVLYSDNAPAENVTGLIYSRQAVTNCFLEKVKRRYKIDNRTDKDQLYKRHKLLPR